MRKKASRTNSTRLNREDIKLNKAIGKCPRSWTSAYCYTETTALIKRSRREPPAMQGGEETLDSRTYKIYKKAPLC